MATGLLRTFYGPAAESPYNLQDITRFQAEDDALTGGELGRGFRTGLRGATGSVAEFAGAGLEKYGFSPRPFYNFADDQRAAAQNLAPSVPYLEDVNSLSDAGLYAASKFGQGVGSIIPAVAGSVLSRNPYVGAAAVSYPMVTGETLGEMRTDPTISQLPIQERFNTAAQYGVPQALLEAVVPAGVGRLGKAGTGAGKHIAKQALEEGFTEGAQQYLGQQALGELDPNRDTSNDFRDIREAAIGGALTGGGVAIPSAARIKAKQIYEDTNAQAKALAQGGLSGDVFNSSTFDLSPLTLTDNKLVGKDIEDTIKRIKDNDVLKVETARVLGKHFGIDGDPNDPAFQEAVKAKAQSSDFAENSKRALKSIKDAASNIKTKIVSKQSQMTESLPDLESVVFSHLTADAAQSEDIRNKLPELTKHIASLAANSDTMTRTELRNVISKLKTSSGLFEDPVALFNEVGTFVGAKQNLFDAAMRSSNAESDATNESSYLFRALRPEVADSISQSQAKALGRFIDEYATLNLDKDTAQGVLKALGRDAFGSERAAADVLQFYARKNRDVTDATDLGVSEVFSNAVEEAAVDNPTTSAINEAPAPEKSYIYSEPSKKRPFRALYSKDMKIIRQKATDFKGRNAGVVNTKFRTLDKVHEGATPEARKQLARSVYKDVMERYKTASDSGNSEQAAALRAELETLKQIVESKEPLTVANRKVDGGITGILQVYGVLEAEQNVDNATKPATDDELKSMRTKLDARTKETAQAVDATKITFTREGKNPIALSAESIWKTMAKRKDTENKKPRDLVKDGIASVLSRPDITGIKYPEGMDEKSFFANLVLDTKTEETVARKPTIKGVGSEPISVEALRERMNSAVDSYVEASDNPKEQERILEVLNNWLEQAQTALDSQPITKSGRPSQRTSELAAQVKLLRETYEQLDDDFRIEAIDRRDYMFEEQKDKSGPRIYEEDTGLKVGAEKRKNSGIVKKSAMNGTPAAGPTLSAEEKQQVIDYVHRVVGKKVQVEFAKLQGGSGEYTFDKKTGERIIRVMANTHSFAMSMAYHEAMHDFFTMLTVKHPTEGNRKLAKDLIDLSESPAVKRQLEKLLANHPAALNQLSNKEELLSYAYQFWAAGQLTLGETGNSTFSKILNFFRKVFRIVRDDERLDKIFSAFHEGKFSEVSSTPSIVAEVLNDIGANTFLDKINKHAKPLTNAANAIYTSATDRLRQTNIPALAEIADEFHRDPGNEQGGLGLLQRRARKSGQFLNRLQVILKDTTESERMAMLKNFQSMKPATSPKELEIRNFLNEVYDYMKEAGVKNVFGVKGAAKDVQFVKDYFPRVWDYSKIRENAQEFAKLLKQHGGMSDDAIKEFITSTVNHPEGTDIAGARATDKAGYTPYAPHVRSRVLTFINASNAQDFTKFQHQNLMETLTAYVFQATHRAEFTRSFGNDGVEIFKKLELAKEQGASNEELNTAVKAISSLEGTLGNDLDPKLRGAMATIITYENIVLLPLALFSNLIDPLGYFVRTGDIKEAWAAAKEGAKGFKQALSGAEPDEGEKLARMLGIIDEHNMLESMGHVYQSMYMNKHLKQMNMTFFKYNGMDLWTRRTRIAGVWIGQRFILKNKDNPEYMRELGLEPGDIKQLPDVDGQVRLALTQAEGLTKEQEQRMQEALFRFVDSAIVRPNAAHRPIWGSDPRFMLFFHLKQFTFSFQNVILKRVRAEVRQGKAWPVWALASYVPFMFFSDLIRGSITGTINNVSMLELMGRSVERSGILGVGGYGLDAAQDLSRGQIPGASLVGPAAEHALLAGKTLLGAPGADVSDLMLRSLPAYPLVKATL